MTQRWCPGFVSGLWMALRETGSEHCKSGQETNDVEMLCKYSKERGNEGEFSLTLG